MKILAISKELQAVDWDSLRDILKEEALTLHNLYLADQVREFYFTDEGDAVVILECGSSEEARGILQKLPLVNHGLIRFEVMELTPYTGFCRLFSFQNTNSDL